MTVVQEGFRSTSVRGPLRKWSTYFGYKSLLTEVYRSTSKRIVDWFRLKCMLETLEEMERRVTQRTLYRDNHSVETQANLRRLVELHERLIVIARSFQEFGFSSVSNTQKVKVYFKSFENTTSPQQEANAIDWNGQHEIENLCN